MTDPRPRLTPLDWAILAIAAACGGLAVASSEYEFPLLRQYRASHWGGPTFPASGPPWSFARVEPAVSRAIQDLEAFLYPLQVGLFLVAFRPRRGIPRPRRGPGQVALAVAAILIFYSMTWFCIFTYGPEWWTGPRAPNYASTPQTFWFSLPLVAGRRIAYAVIAAWTYLAVIGGWRNLRRPFERPGIVLGATWILASAIAWALGLINDG